jgi:LysR family cys regulon transcriptional activator
VNFQQIEAVCGIVRNGFNISTAAKVLHRSQPTLSRQIQDLEHELGLRIFTRTRNRVVALTPEGEVVLRIGQRIVLDMKDLAQAGKFESAEGPAELKIATTHLHARYSLPHVMKAFATHHPGLLLTLRQGDPIQCCELVAAGEADIGITTVDEKAAGDIVTIPAFRLARCVIAPRDHPIVREKTLTLQKLAKYPIIAYSAPFSGRWIVEEAFARAGLRPHVVCSAIDADVSKTYVELGMGIAILARIAFEPERDRNLVAMAADHLFRPSILNLVLRKHGYLSRHAHEFLSLFAPHIGADLVRMGMDGTELDRVRLSHEAPLAKYVQLPVS